MDQCLSLLGVVKWLVVHAYVCTAHRCGECVLKGTMNKMLKDNVISEFIMCEPEAILSQLVLSCPDCTWVHNSYNMYNHSIMQHCNTYGVE